MAPTTGLRSADLKTHMTRAVQEVFDTMLSMHLTPTQARPPVIHDHDRIVGMVGFTGTVTGALALHMGEPFARLVTAALLRVPVQEVVGGEDLNDAVGELTNMVTGRLKAGLAEAGHTCALSIPSITRGRDFEIQSMSAAKREDSVFACNEHHAVVEVYLQARD